MLFDVEIAEDNSLLLRHEREGSCFQRPSLEKYFVSEDEVLRLDQVSCEDPTTLWYKWLRILVPRLQHESIEALKEMFTPCRAFHEKY
jgi:hypothetical protein